MTSFLFLLYIFEHFNDATTDLDRVPSFHFAQQAFPEQDYTYNSQFVSKQKKYFPSLAPLICKGKQREVFDKTRALAEELGWKLVGENGKDQSDWTVQSQVFKFVDDVTIQIRPHGDDEWEIHMRSKSRVGRSDLGANAERIQNFLELLSKK